MKSRDPWDTIVTDAFGDIIWPRTHYGHPFYREIPSWIHYGDAEDDGSRRLLFDGAFIGAERAPLIPTLETTSMTRPQAYYMGAEAPQSGPRRGLLADGAPLVAPATGPITLKKELDAHQVLHVEICVDGKCYQTSMDLGPAIQMVLAKLAQWHKAQHSVRETPPSSVVGAIETAIGAAGDAMADTLVCQHVNVMLDKAQHSEWGGQLWEKIMGGTPATVSSGWYPTAVAVGGFWDSVGDAVTAAVMPAVTGTKMINQFVHDQGLEPYVKLAAQGVATAYGGPAAGAAVSALAPAALSLGVEDKAKATAAQQDVQGVTALAQQHSPQMAQAVDVAKGAIKGTAAAYHIDHLLKRAKRGDARARRALARLRSLAEGGNQDAQKALQAVNTIHLEQQRTTVSGWYDIVGAVISAGGGGRG